MKRLILICICLLSSCTNSVKTPIYFERDNSGQELINPSPFSTPTASPEISNQEESNINPDEITYTNHENKVISCGTLKDNLSNLKIECPTNIAANKDFVYFTSSFNGNYSIPKNCEYKEPNKLGFIYKIDKNKRLDVVKTFDDKPIYGCPNTYSEIQTNSKNELFFSDKDIKKISNGKITNLTNDRQILIDNEKKKCDEIPYYSPSKVNCTNYSDYYNFNIQEDFIYYMSGYSNFFSNKDEFIKYNGKKSIIADLNNFTNNHIYTIVNNDIYLLDYIYGEEFKIIKLNPNVSNINFVHKPSEDKSFFEVIAVLRSVVSQTYANSNLDGKDNSPYDKNPLTLNKYITQLKANSKGELFFNDIQKNLIWKVTPKKDQVVMPVIFAGSMRNGYRDDKALESEFNYPSSIDFDENDNMYVADTANNAIRKITPDGIVSTFYKSN